MTPPPAVEQLAPRLFTGAALRAQPDRRLVRLVREGYEAAFEEIVRRYGKPLGRYAAAIVGGRSEDVTQDAFSKALLALRRDGEEIELRPWLYRIVRNTALNDLRDRPPVPEALAEGVAGGRGPAEEVERREELAELTARLRALPEQQRTAIVMRELEGLGHEEIAAALGMSGGAARQAIYRARRALRDGLGMLLPLPLLRAMLATGGSGATEAAAGAAGVTGAGLAFKAGAATMLVAGAVGAGVALHGGHGAAPPSAAAAEAAKDDGGGRATAADSPAMAGRATAHLPRRGGGDPAAAAHRGERRGERAPGVATPAHGGSTGHGGDSNPGDEERHSGATSPSVQDGGGDGSGDNPESSDDSASESEGTGSGSTESVDGPGDSGGSGEQQPSGDGEPSGTSGDGGSASSPDLSASSDLNGPYEESPGDS